MGKLKILKSYLQTIAHPQFSDREKLEKWQDAKARSLLEYVIKKSSFYAELYAGKDLHSWKEFPTINKLIMMENFSTLNTAKICKEDAYTIAMQAEQSRNFAPMINGYTIGLSSGTSGNRGMFLVSSDEKDAWAGYILAKMLPKPIFRKQDISFFLRANSNLYQNLSSKTISFKFYDLITPFRELAQTLNARGTDILVAPPSALYLLAQAQQAGEIAINPTKIVSVADVLEEHYATVIEKAFGKRVHQVYQATEGLIASTCSEGTLHLHEDSLVIQKKILGERRFSPIITDLRRHTQPIIRYQLDDILVERETPCPCGSIYTALDHIEGRCDDIIRKKEKVIFPDFLRRAIITSSEAITDYQFKYYGADAQLWLATDASHCDVAYAQASQAIIKVFEQQGIAAPTISPMYTQTVPSLANKRRRILNESTSN